MRVKGCIDPGLRVGAEVGLAIPDVDEELEVGGVAAEWQRTASTQEHRAIEAKSRVLLDKRGAEAGTAMARLVLR